MRLESSFKALNQYRKKMFRRVKEAVMKTKKKKKQTMFQYDPSSYALNFDDGGEVPQRFSGDFKHCKITLIYVVSVKFWEFSLSFFSHSVTVLKQSTLVSVSPSLSLSFLVFFFQCKTILLKTWILCLHVTLEMIYLWSIFVTNPCANANVDTVITCWTLWKRTKKNCYSRSWNTFFGT